MKFLIKSFLELNTFELYQILQLRSKVFVVEQNCIYQDVDGKDEKSLHVLGISNDNKIIAYSRLFKPDDYFKEASIGRVVVAFKERGHGYGHDLMKISIKAIKNRFKCDTISISAQKQLKLFYETHSFYQIGKEYLEDGIPHIKMIRN